MESTPSTQTRDFADVVKITRFLLERSHFHNRDLANIDTDEVSNSAPANKAKMIGLKIINNMIGS